MWKAEVRQSWRMIGLEEFCAQIGVAFSFAFEGALENCNSQLDPYLHYRWVVLENSRIPFGVLHLVPPLASPNPMLWEEWFVDEGRLHHHVLRNHPHDRATDIWSGELSDTDHPREVLGLQWHHFNDEDPRPVKYR